MHGRQLVRGGGGMVGAPIEASAKAGAPICQTPFACLAISLSAEGRMAFSARRREGRVVIAASSAVERTLASGAGAEGGMELSARSSVADPVSRGRQ